MKVKDKFIQDIEDKNEELDQEYQYLESILNKEQINAYIEAIDSRNKIIYITGEGGTGKSFVSNYILKYFSQRFYSNEIICLAPSHQSKVVLRDFINNKNIEVKTTQSHCNFIPDFDTEKDFKHTGIKPDYKELVLIDEISMVSDEQFQMILRNSNKVICLGDKNQLKSVGGNMANLEGVLTVDLIKQMRQENTETSLYKAITRFKNAIENKTKVTMVGVGEDDTLKLVRKRKELFSSFIHCEYNSKVLVAAKNDMVNKYNLEVKKTLSGKVYDIGDILIAQSPIWCEGNSTKLPADFNNGDIVEVHSIERVDDKTLSYVKVGISYTDATNIKYTRIPIDKDKYLGILQDSIQIAKLDKNQWKHYYELKNKFADFKHAYSMTGWKTQGSSFDEVFIDHPDISTVSSWSNYDTYLRVMYVSLSRAKKKATILL